MAPMGHHKRAAAVAASQAGDAAPSPPATPSLDAPSKAQQRAAKAQKTRAARVAALANTPKLTALFKPDVVTSATDDVVAPAPKRQCAEDKQDTQAHELGGDASTIVVAPAAVAADAPLDKTPASQPCMLLDAVVAGAGESPALGVEVDDRADIDLDGASTQANAPGGTAVEDVGAVVGASQMAEAEAAAPVSRIDGAASDEDVFGAGCGGASVDEVSFNVPDSMASFFDTPPDLGTPGMEDHV